MQTIPQLKTDPPDTEDAAPRLQLRSSVLENEQLALDENGSHFV